jgi:eukaryotic-like serine/threonine-protein kinase
MDSPSWDAKIDKLCDEFESALREGASPRIEDYLSEEEGEQTEQLFRELLYIELERSEYAGNPQSVEDIVARFPDRASSIRNVFSEMADASLPSLTTRNSKKPPTGDIACTSRFENLEFHAQGGLGQVFRAHDQHLKRSVALKFIRTDMKDDEEASGRFRLEAEVTSRLDHPGVVPVYAMGECESGRSFYAMRFIDGKDLRAAANEFHKRKSVWSATERKLRLFELLRHLASACRTVAYAHNRGVLHRDIKPENIMLGRFGETLVVDWGLVHFVARGERAKASGEKTLMPSAMHDSNLSSNSAAGTIGYLSPEQTPNSGMEIGPASDIYSLGASLYRILVGAAPFHHQQGQAVWEQIRTGDFPTPRLIDSAIPRDLEAICMKAMSERPEERYHSPLDLAEDIERWIADEPVSARPPDKMETVSRFARRHRTGAIAVGTAVVSVLTAIIAITLILTDKRADVLQGEAEYQAREAERSNEAAEKEAAAKEKIEVIQKETLIMAAEFAANSLGHQIDRRWQALYEALSRPEPNGDTVHGLIVQTTGVNDDPIMQSWDNSDDRDAIVMAWRRDSGAELRDWLDVHAAPWCTHDLAASWFINDNRGHQLARHPYERSIGRNFAYRSYFQCEEYDIPRNGDTIPQYPMIDESKLSMPYVCSNTGRLKVVLSIPLRENEGDDPVGILAMSVELGAQMNAFIDPDQESSYIVVNLNSDSLDGLEQLQRGAVIKHADLRTSDVCYRVDPTVLDGLDDGVSSCLVEGFIDPLHLERPPVQAAIARVQVAARDTFGDAQEFADRVDSGWAVIVPNSEEASDNSEASRGY